MSRRLLTLLVGAVLLTAMSWLSVGVKVPYVELTPGPTWNTLGTSGGQPVIQVTGAATSTSTGQLRMVTVGEVPDISLWEALQGWLNGDDAVVPREVIYPPDQSTQQVDQQEQQEMTESQDSAQTAALRVLGYPVLITVSSVTAGQPAQGRLAIGDVITSVDGQHVTSQGNLVSLIQAKPPGTALVIGYTRGGTAATTTITTIAGSDGKAHIGVGVAQSQPHPFTVTVRLAGVAGPSAGLMFALGIIDKLEPPDLTGGLVIAGTGTIDDDGNVGPIGGIAQKMRGARQDGATVFLVPAPNCDEAVHNAIPGLRLVKVNTLDQALQALQTLRSHGDPPSCAG